MPGHLAAIGLGSNLGDRDATLQSAIAALRELGDVNAFSRLYETAPVGYTDQPPFLNAAVLLQTDLSPRSLLDQLLYIERSHGRDRTAAAIPKGPRTLDLDLLLYDDLVLHTPGLIIPHPELHTRRFVLEPLAEIAPRLIHPVLQEHIAALLSRL